MTIQHWLPPDVRGDILAAALRPDAAAPLVVHVRPEVRDRMGPRPLSADPTARDGAGPCIPVVVDDELPRSPGYEVHRVPPATAGGPRPELRLAAEEATAVDAGTWTPAPCTARSWTGGTRRRARSRELRWLRDHLGSHRHQPA